MKLFVTGGAGFIGSNFIRHIIQKYPDYEVLNFDKLTYSGNLDNLRGIEKDDRYKFVKGDICSKQDVEKAMEGCDIAVNFAAESHVDRSIEDSGIFLNVDVLGVHRLLEAARKLDIQRFIQISTDEVYGDIPEGSSKETDMLNPSNPYSAGKAGGEMLALSYWRTFKTPVIITRSSNNYGAYQYPEKLIPRFFVRAMGGRKVPVYGTGGAIRDWLYVKDNCEAIDLVMHKGRLGNIYNIGGKCNKTCLEITKEILNYLGKGEEWIEFAEDRLGHDMRYSLDITKIKDELGWEPKNNFSSAMKETLDWYKDNREWWEKLLKKDREHI
ncbi:dTDP-glucose 4,6-dehydratase [Candidatus Woesearchaeota archaeon]|nr:dTDP-glucose 4,6-dehydratase [Candidatus Woesearchaeota archaeon]